MNVLSGWKTYILAAVIAIASAAKYLGYITEELYQAVVGIAGSGAAITLRSALKNAADPVGKNE